MSPVRIWEADLLCPDSVAAYHKSLSSFRPGSESRSGRLKSCKLWSSVEPLRFYWLLNAFHEIISALLTSWWKRKFLCVYNPNLCLYYLISDQPEDRLSPASAIRYLKWLSVSRFQARCSQFNLGWKATRDRFLTLVQICCHSTIVLCVLSMFTVALRNVGALMKD